MRSKTGRKQKHHVNSATGKPVVGLSKMKDGRWRIIGTQIRFSEQDEQRAIEKYRAITNSETHDERLLKAVSERMEKFERVLAPLRDQHHPLWKDVAEYIRTRPQWVAEATGIEQIGYLRDLKPPETVPSFSRIETEWKDHFKKSAEQRRRVLHAWEDFKKTTDVKALGEITPEVAIAYRDVVYGRNLTPKMESNIFTQIRRLFTFVRSRELAPDAMAKAIDALKRLIPSDSALSLDPQPIEPEQFKMLLNAADDENRAMLLLMLNGAYYCAEVVRLKWYMIKDGCIVSHRAKEGRCVRVCVLWPETIDALKKLKRKDDHIFVAYTGRPLGTKGAELRFRTLRTDAKVSTTVTSSHLRDGAATAMAQAGVTDKFFAIAMGHRSGISDHYVKRNPKMVAPAAIAIHDHYFPVAPPQ